MQKWEYCTLVYNIIQDEMFCRFGSEKKPVEGNFQEYFDVLGADGWELCGYAPAGKAASFHLHEVAHFKRPKADA